MSLQGPIIVVAENPCGELTDALVAAGAFPVIESTWADAPTAFISVKPCAIVIAEPGPLPSEANARMLCLQVATATGPTVPVLARSNAGDMPIPIAVTIDAALPPERLIARLHDALRVRALHSTVLRRIETFGSEHGKLPELPVGDPLEESTVMIVGRGPLYPALSVAVGERFGLLGALSVETAAKHLNSRDINGIVIGDGFGAQMIEAFLTALSESDRFRAIPLFATGGVPDALVAQLPNANQLGGSPAGIVARMIPAVRLHAFESRLKRMLAALASEGTFDPETALLTRDHFWRELKKAIEEAGRNAHALSVARISLGDLPSRQAGDAARLFSRLVRESDFACRDDDGTMLIAFGQTDLRSAHVVVRRIVTALRQSLLNPKGGAVEADVTLATFKGSDTLDSLMMRVNGAEVVAAE